MKNVIKKMLSLLLVGVVTVSMFSFITPNRVDAEVKFLRYFVHVVAKAPGRGGQDGYYNISFFDKKEEPIIGSIKPVGFGSVKEEDFYVPRGAATMKFEALSPRAPGCKTMQTNFTLSFIFSKPIKPLKDKILEITIDVDGARTKDVEFGCQIRDYSNHIIR